MTLPGVFIHRDALVESDQIGEGTRVWAWAHVMEGARVGKNCNICEHCFVESGALLGNNVTVKNGVSVWNKVQVGDNVFLGPNVTLTNDFIPRAEVKKSAEDLLPTVIGNGATLGANATIVCGVTIGEYAFIGAGAVVLNDVPDYQIQVGNPARPIGWMCACGAKLDFSGSTDAIEGVNTRCDKCRAHYRRQSGRVWRIPEDNLPPPSPSGSFASPSSKTSAPAASVFTSSSVKTQQRIPVAVIVPVLNEELNIDAVLHSVCSWAAQVFVLDSYSTDHTLELAARYPVQIVQHAFAGYAQQWNWALDHLPFQQEWVLLLAADERVTPELILEMQHLFKSGDPSVNAYFVNRRLLFLNAWLKHGGLFPSWSLRLFRHSQGRFEERSVNEHLVIAGKTGYLKGCILHEDMKSLSRWIERHNRYATLEANEWKLQPKQVVRLSKDPIERKKWLRMKIWDRFPLLFRPGILFIRNYIFLLGCLDGIPGLIYHVLWSFWYPFLIDVKIYEMNKLQLFE